MDANPIVLDESAGDVVVVVVEGEHDIYTAPTLRERLEEALSHGGGIVVDLTAATFVDSSVLGALLDARRRARVRPRLRRLRRRDRRARRAADPGHHTSRSRAPRDARARDGRRRRPRRHRAG